MRMSVAEANWAHVWVFDNDDLHYPYRLAAVFENGLEMKSSKPMLLWLRRLLKSR